MSAAATNCPTREKVFVYDVSQYSFFGFVHFSHQNCCFLPEKACED